MVKVQELQLNSKLASIGKILRFLLQDPIHFWCYFLAISPQHPIATEIARNDKEAQKFINFCEKQSTSEVEIEKGEKFGYKTQLTSGHPFINGKNYLFL